MNWKAAIMGALFAGATIHAESAPSGQVVEQVPAAKSTTVIGGIDMRPSWTTKTGEFHTENSVSLGVKTVSDLSVSFVHNFNTNLFQPLPEGSGGVNPTAVDAYFKAGLPSLWTSADSTTTLTYAPRIYVPIQDAARERGMITAVRNYFNLKKTISPTVALTITELPILHVYSQPGSVTATGASANPVFENRVYLIGDFQLAEKVALSVPILFHATRHRSFQEGAANDNSMSYFLWVFPEITYSMTSNLSVGLAYYSDNLVDSKLASLAIGSGLEQGVLQFSLAATL